MRTAPPSRRARLQGKSDNAKHEAAATRPTPHFAPREATKSPAASAANFDFSAPPGYYNAAAKMALLRQGKRPPHHEVLVDFSREQVNIELRAKGQLLISGAWSWQVTVAGQELTQTGEWKQTRWHRENSCDCLEIELPLSHGFKLQRHIFLARENLFVVLADCLIGPPAAASEIRYSHSLPFASDVSFSPAAETREGWFETKKVRRARVVPLAMAEWRAEFCHAELSTADQRLTLRQAALGRALFSPLWIDLDPRRLKRPLTWRQLTVGENLTSVPRDVAAGYRVQVGDEQWLIYRSLAPVANRSVLGHNTYAPLAYGQIRPDGSVKELLNLE